MAIGGHRSAILLSPVPMFPETGMPRSDRRPSIPFLSDPTVTWPAFSGSGTGFPPGPIRHVKPMVFPGTKSVERTRSHRTARFGPVRPMIGPEFRDRSTGTGSNSFPTRCILIGSRVMNGATTISLMCHKTERTIVIRFFLVKQVLASFEYYRLESIVGYP